MGNQIFLWRIIRRLLGIIRRKLLRTLNVFYVPIVYRYYEREILKLEPNTKIFIFIRTEFGIQLLLAHYIALWEKIKKTPTCIVCLSPILEMNKILSIMSPNTQIIYYHFFWMRWWMRIFNRYQVLEKTFYQVYDRLIEKGLDEIHIYTPQSLIKSKKEIQEGVLTPFQHAYHTCLGMYDQKHFSTYQEYASLSKHTELSWNIPYSKTLLQKLGLNKRYFILHLNLTNYWPNSPRHIATRRGVQYPQRYNTLIDYIIEKGYQVVLYGRKEHSLFLPRKNFIDYSNKHLCSIEKDFILFQNASGFISSKSGAEFIGPICNVPTLGLNYVELASMTIHKKMRFFPKHLRLKSSDQKMHWKELLVNPVFFDMGNRGFVQDIEYIDLSEEEMISAFNEFVLLLDAQVNEWQEGSPLQKQFKNLVTSMHLDLYLTDALPCQAYLTSF